MGNGEFRISQQFNFEPQTFNYSSPCTKITLPLFSVSDVILTSYLLLPSVTIIKAVFGGIVPRFSAYIVTIFSLAPASKESVSDTGLSVNFLCDKTNFSL
jgi:hypothetical protein